jgi:hypothetical protein
MNQVSNRASLIQETLNVALDQPHLEHFDCRLRMQVNVFTQVHISKSPLS